MEMKSAMFDADQNTKASKIVFNVESEQAMEVSKGFSTVNNTYTEPNHCNVGKDRECSRSEKLMHTNNVNTTHVGDTTSTETEKVNLAPPIIGYFGFMFGTVAINVFLGVILVEKGFTTFIIGFLLSFIPFCIMTLLPVMSYIADKFHCPTLMLSACAICSAIAIYIFCVSTNRTVVIIFFLLQAVCQKPMNPLLDRHTLMMFPPVGRAVAWGYVRAFGAYGWGVGSPVAAGLVWWCNSWTIVCVQFCLGQVALLYCMWKTKPYVNSNVNSADSNEQHTSMHLRDVWLVFWENKRLPLFLFASCMMGMGYSFINNFLFIFFSSINGPKILLGLTIVFTVSTEIPIFQFSHLLFKWFTYRQMISLGMVIWAFRVVIYSFITIPWTVLIIEPLHGVTYGLLWLPSVKVVSQAFPAKLSSTATGILFTFSAGIGPIIGNEVAGVLYDKVGPRWMFRLAVITMMIGLIIYQADDRVFEKLGYKLTNDESTLATDNVQIEDCKNRVELTTDITNSTHGRSVECNKERNLEQRFTSHADNSNGNNYNNNEIMIKGHMPTVVQEMQREDVRCAMPNSDNMLSSTSEELLLV